MTTSNNRGKTPTKIPRHSLPASLISPPQQTHAATAGRVDTEDLIAQFQASGLKPAQAARFLDAALSALDRALESLDSHALAAAPVAEQVSMLLPRFDVGTLARDCRIAKADVQSALALLVLSFVAGSRHSQH